MNIKIQKIMLTTDDELILEFKYKFLTIHFNKEETNEIREKLNEVEEK